MTPPNELAQAPAAAPQKPGYKFHSADNVAIASFLGSPIAGAWLMALNERRAGTRARYRNTVLLGLLFTAIALAIGFGLSVVMPKTPSYWLPIAYVMGMRGWAQSAQGKMLEAHLAANGVKAGVGSALGTGLVCLVLVLIGMVGLISVGPDSLQDRYEAAKGQYIEYEDGATRAEAMKLGESLKTAGVLTGSHPMDVKLARQGKKGFALSFVVDAENRTKPEIQDSFRAVREAVSADMKEPVEIRLCDPDWTPRETIKAPAATP